MDFMIMLNDSCKEILSLKFMQNLENVEMSDQ